MKNFLGLSLNYSAFGDTRFVALEANELDGLALKVSLLHSFESVDDILKGWTLGVHGIRLSFTLDKTQSSLSFSGTFLPEVPVEQHWVSTKQTLLALVEKAFGGRKKKDWPSAKEIIDFHAKYQVKLVRYQTQSAEMTYLEYSTGLTHKDRKTEEL